MMAKNDARGFTLIELLTVIAIIAVLAALLFPVFGRVNNSRRITQCISNLHKIYVAANLYKDDEGGYPPMLLGPAERPDGKYWVTGDPGPVDANAIQHGFLYPKYINDIDVYRCPDNQEKNLGTVTPGVYSTATGWPNVIPDGVATFDKNGFRFENLAAAYTGKTVAFYGIDSYDITAAVGLNGTRLKDGTGNPVYYVAYSRDWSAAKARGIDPKKDGPNQLIYARTAPLDHTVLTFCNAHVATSHFDKCPVILASGTAKTLDFKQVSQLGWMIIQ